MSASKDRVRFFLAQRYFTGGPNGMKRATCIDVLNRAFCPSNGTGSSWGALMTAMPQGFSIVCRPSQFARFIIFRHEAGECINGVRDLKPTLFKPRDLYQRISDEFGISKSGVHRIAGMLKHEVDGHENTLDVSDHFNKEPF